MSAQDKLTQKVQAGEIIRPWLILGPFYEDMSASVVGLTLFERAGAPVGRAAMAEVMAEAAGVLALSPQEGAETAFRGQPGRWSLVRRPENYLSWGTYNIQNTLGAAFFSTMITPDQPGAHRWRLALRITSRAVVALNGMIVYDSDAHPVKAVEGVYEHQFEAELAPGENLLNVAVFRLGRMAQVGFRLEMTDGDLTARIEPPENMSLSTRQQVEEQVSSVRLARDVFYPEHHVGFRIGAAPAGGVTLRASLLDEAGKVLREQVVSAAGEVVLAQGSEIEDGLYRIDPLLAGRERAAL